MVYTISSPYLPYHSIWYVYLVLIISYFAIFPLILVLTFKSNFGNLKCYISDKGLVKILQLFLVIYLINEMLTLAPNFFKPDSERATLYIRWLDEKKIMPIFLISLMLFKLSRLCNKKLIYLQFLIVAICDVIMGRRHLIALSIHPILKYSNFKQKIIFFFLLLFLTAIRHGVENWTLVWKVGETFFSEAYMITASSITHFSCNVTFTIENFFNFERATEECRKIPFSAGGFLSRVIVDPWIGLISIIFFSLIVGLWHLFIARYILSNFKLIYDIVMFETLFILFRDDMGNAISFFLQYNIILVSLSIFLMRSKSLSKFGVQC